MSEKQLEDLFTGTTSFTSSFSSFLLFYVRLDAITDVSKMGKNHLLFIF
jgi:hypothetical protein